MINKFEYVDVNDINDTLQADYYILSKLNKSLYFYFKKQPYDSLLWVQFT